MTSSPGDIYLGAEKIQKTYLNDKFIPGGCGLLGFGAICFMNWGLRVPVFSGIQKHLIAATLGAAIGKYFDDKRSNYLAERDAVYRHYIELHPEDFPPVERKKWGDVMEEWVPIR